MSDRLAGVRPLLEAFVAVRVETCRRDEADAIEYSISCYLNRGELRYLRAALLLAYETALPRMMPWRHPDEIRAWTRVRDAARVVEAAVLSTSRAPETP